MSGRVLGVDPRGPVTMGPMTEFNAETAIAVGGWDPRFARVLDVQVDPVRQAEVRHHF